MNSRNGEFRNFYFFLGSLLLLSGCSIEARILDFSSTKLLNAAHTQGFVASSSQNDKTASGYKVQSSSGTYSDKIEEVTSAGYKVYISTQGTLISDQ